MMINKNYKLTKYLIVSDSFGIIAEGLADEQVILLSYQDLIKYLKLRKK